MQMRMQASSLSSIREAQDRAKTRGAGYLSRARKHPVNVQLMQVRQMAELALQANKAKVHPLV